MKTKLYFIRKSKSLFIRFKLHKLVEPFTGALLNLAYMSKLSKWAHANKIPFNDFYQSKWDYSRRLKLYEYLLKEEQLENNPITYLEFGVATGVSFRWWAERNKHPESRFHGFDTFTGLPEDWGPYKAGDMSSNNQVPDIADSRVKFYTGLFQQTLPPFLKTFDNSRRKLIHMDADLYSSTLFVLTSIAPFLSKGDVIMFDEYAVPTHEFLALKNFTESYYCNLQPIGAANNYLFAAFKVV